MQIFDTPFSYFEMTDDTPVLLHFEAQQPLLPHNLHTQFWAPCVKF